MHAAEIGYMAKNIACKGFLAENKSKLITIKHKTSEAVLKKPNKILLPSRMYVKVTMSWRETAVVPRSREMKCFAGIFLK